MTQVFKGMIGLTFTSVRTNGDELIFELPNGERHVFYHSQDCCESVSIESIDGDLKDLVGEPIQMAEEVSSEGEPYPGTYAESFTWTFYKFGTIRGYVAVRWLGTSNGYYSEGVSYCAPGERRW